MSDEAQELTSIEQKALDMGWSPLEKWKGDPERWIEAEEFVRRGEEFVPFLKKDLAATRDEVKQLKEMLQKQDDQLKRMSKTQEKALLKAREQERERMMLEFERSKRMAAEAGDLETFDKLTEEQQKAQKLYQDHEKQPEIEKQPGISPDFPEWHRNNPWYGTDQRLTAYANHVIPMVSQYFSDKGEKPSDREWYAEITKRTKEAFPESFANPNRERAADVGSTGLGSNESKKDKKPSYKDLPQEAKDACDKFVSQGLMTKEQYVHEYFEE